MIWVEDDVHLLKNYFTIWITWRTWSESVAWVSVESRTGLNVKHDAGADIDSALLAGDVDVEDVNELSGEAVAVDMVNCKNKITSILSLA